MSQYKLKVFQRICFLKFRTLETRIKILEKNIEEQNKPVPKTTLLVRDLWFPPDEQTKILDCAARNQQTKKT
tara:strand:+ start:597 stop:812 length:216 start_codon:yes stop_codon:yes gene_type:complete